MASATWAEISAQLKNGIKPFTDLLTIFPTIVTSIDTAEQAYEGDFMPGGIEAALATLRSDLSATYGRSKVRAVWNAFGREVMRLGGFPETDPGQASGVPGQVGTSGVDLWARLHRHMHDNSLTFNDRDWTRGAFSAVTGTGTGLPLRLSVDWEGYNLQGGHVETKTWECYVDQNTGALKGAEQFWCRGEDRSKDALDYQGSGLFLGPYVVKHSGSGSTPIRNASWDASFSGTSTDKIPNWTIAGTAANITAATGASNIFVASPGVTPALSGSLLFAIDGAATNEVTQALSVANISAGGERVPWMAQVAYRCNNAGCTGTLNLKMGNQTATKNLATVGDTNWHILSMTIDKNLYYRNWKEDAPDIEIEVVNLAVGTLNVDALRFAPWDYIDGAYYWIPGGATAFLQRDKFTTADSGPTAATSELMYAADYAQLPISLPSATAGGETVTDP